MGGHLGRGGALRPCQEAQGRTDVALLVVAYDVGGPALVAAFSALRAAPVLVIGPVLIGRSDRGARERVSVADGRERGLSLAEVVVALCLLAGVVVSISGLLIVA